MLARKDTALLQAVSFLLSNECLYVNESDNRHMAHSYILFPLRLAHYVACCN
ncbi:MAG: hypothetical protein K0R78_1063 [Pelosinus sp.]|nr:hypothetical protein [Pelosinus sp.]